jgi:hypothetical protein
MIVRELLSVFGIDFDDAGQKKADAALKGLQGQATLVGQFLSQLSGLLAGSAIFGVFTHAADAAARLAEHVRRTNAVFGEGAGAVHAWSQSMGQTMGRSEGTLLGLANAMKPVADGMTESDAEAAKMSTTLAELAVNMGAFFGETDEEALGALRMGMMGMDRQLKKYGIRLNDESLAEFARSKGLRSNVKDMKESEKAHLRYLKILESTTKYQGAAQKALERYSGAKKRLSERVNDLWEAMGKSLLPVFAKVFTVMSTGIERFLAFADRTDGMRSAMISLAIVGAGVMLPVLLGLLAPLIPLLVAFAAFVLIMDEVIQTFMGADTELRQFTEALDLFEKYGTGDTFLDGLITAVNRFRDAMGTAMLLVYALFEAIATGSVTPLKYALEGAGEEWKAILAKMGVSQGAGLKAPGILGTPGGQATQGGTLPGWLSTALGWVGVRQGGGLSPSMVQASPSSIDAAGLANRQVTVQAGDQKVEINVSQEPGESPEDFAQRVAEIVRDENVKHNEDLYHSLVQQPTPVTP